MKNFQYFYKDIVPKDQSKNFDFNQTIAGQTCVTTPGTTWSGKPTTREYCYDLGDDSSGPIIIGISLGAFTIVLLIILLIKKNNSNLENFKNPFAKNFSLKKQKKESLSSETDLIEKLKETDFPNLSISESFIKGNFIIVKDLEGKIIAEVKIDQIDKK